MNEKKRLAFLVSGNGTNMQNLVREIRDGRLEADPVVVISDKPGAGALERAAKFGVEALVLDRKAFPDKASFENTLAEALDRRRIDCIVLAGFMRILSEAFVKRYEGRIVNIHPALLPAFPGAHGILDAFNAGVKETGVTVHFVDAGVDTGPVILQERVSVDPGETLESLERKIHEVEYRLYPRALRMVLSGRLGE
jgi:phosphoribosylglycinamide formyltransferase-1